MLFRADHLKVARYNFRHSQRENEKSTETRVACFIIINPSFLPEFCTNLITRFQCKNNSIACIPIGDGLPRKHRALDLIVLIKTDGHFCSVVCMSIKSEVKDSFYWCCENTWNTRVEVREFKNTVKWLWSASILTSLWIIGMPNVTEYFLIDQSPRGSNRPNVAWTRGQKSSWEGYLLSCEREQNLSSPKTLKCVMKEKEWNVPSFSFWKDSSLFWESWTKPFKAERKRNIICILMYLFTLLIHII